MYLFNYILMPLCLISAVLASAVAHALEIQGHRGARGLWPENTLLGFANALHLGVDVLELDLALTADDVVVISHDPHLNPAITRAPNGQWLSTTGPAIRSISYRELIHYDVGRLNPKKKYSRRYPHQQAIDGAAIPRLAEVYQLVDALAPTVQLNLEIKLRPHGGREYAPVDHFARQVINTIQAHGGQHKTTIQSFDWRALHAAKALAPNIALVALTAQQRWLDNIQVGQPGASPWTNGLDVDDYGGSVPHLVDAISAQIWSPYWRDITQASLNEAHRLGLKVVVWVVNQPKLMQHLINMGVNGIITDYPDRLRRVVKQLNIEFPVSGQ